MTQRDKIVQGFERDIDVRTRMINSCADDVHRIAGICVEILKNDGKIVFFGNGGSAADAQHLAAEFIGRFRKDREALPALALTADGAVLTCLGNDYGYDNIFVRQIEGLVDVKDVCIGLTTSGESKNVITALKRARDKGATTIAWTGEKGEKILRPLVDVLLVIPTHDTALIQQGMMAAGHLICEIVEEEMFAS